jgi:hypothetical protein
MISSHSEEPFANFNIANLNKSAEKFLPNKKACPDLNLQAIDLLQGLPFVKYSAC